MAVYTQFTNVAAGRII